MSSIEVQPQAALGDADEAVVVASAVRAEIDAVLTERAPAERDAFWHAVALLYARGFKPDAQPAPFTPALAPVGGTLEPSHSILETTR
ncbi:MAG: hypothetical protein INR70_23480 [Parafilimonas terrae]|nr:hypothetical protein [Parafilimonas terrae]